MMLFSNVDPMGSISKIADNKISTLKILLKEYLQRLHNMILFIYNAIIVFSPHVGNTLNAISVYIGKLRCLYRNEQ